MVEKKGGPEWAEKMTFSARKTFRQIGPWGYVEVIVGSIGDHYAP